jgi:hypothetical protein
MPPRVYIETSVISYLAARPSRDLITAARQQITHEWWRRRGPRPHAADRRGRVVDRTANKPFHLTSTLAPSGRSARRR